MAHPAHKTLNSNTVLPHVFIDPHKTKLYLPRGSRHLEPCGWSIGYDGPIYDHWKAFAQKKGFDLVKRIRDKDHVALQCHHCGALTSQKVYTLRSAQPACAACKHLSIEDTAQKAGLAFLEYDPENCTLGIYRAACGHKVSHQFGQIERIAQGLCNLRCETCHAGKKAAEAKARGWELLDDDPEENPNYRLYRHHCGHQQRVARANMQTGRFQCSDCGEGWFSGKSAIYAIRLALPTGLRVVKLAATGRGRRAVADSAHAQYDARASPFPG